MSAVRPLYDHLTGGDPDLDIVCATGSEMLAAALGYAAVGWPVFPGHVPTRFGPQGAGLDRAGCSCRDRRDVCIRQAKHGVSRWDRAHPFTEGTDVLTGGITAATTDRVLIERWWRLLPGAGILVHAAAAGLMVIDLDGPASRAVLGALMAEHGRFDAWWSLTARGSHGWLSVPEGARPIAAPRGIELKTGQVTAPPSWHCTGQRYRWVQQEGDRPPTAPDWLLRAEAAPSVPSSGPQHRQDDAWARGEAMEAEDWLVNACALLMRTAAGGRNNRFTSLLGKGLALARDGRLDRDTTVAALSQAASASGLAGGEIAATVASVSAWIERGGGR